MGWELIADVMKPHRIWNQGKAKGKLARHCEFDDAPPVRFHMVVSLTQLRQEVAALPAEEQEALMAFLASICGAHDDGLKRELASKLDDADSARWMALEDVQKRWSD